MHLARIRIRNFRGIAEAEILLTGHTVFVGDNNVGKSTLLEAVDLVLGPERLNRRPVVDEHDFYAGLYVDREKNELIPIQIEVVIADLSEEQQRHFREHIEWWDVNAKSLIDAPPPECTDAENVCTALRVFFNGWYDFEEDDFAGETYYAIPKIADGSFVRFSPRDKRKCGFLYLRTLRTGSRALSLEHGSLLDVILRMKESRLTMWEGLLDQLRTLPVGEGEDVGELLASIQNSVHRYVPTDWAEKSHLRVTDLTRETLRRTLTVFMGTGAMRPDGSIFAAPYQHQGTGTINTLVLALLYMIAELKVNVIFAMEEPEIALSPHTQKRIVNSLRQKLSQAIFTSHSPYVLEEFEPTQVLVLNRTKGSLTANPARYPPTIKPKTYRTEFRTRFCEALLARYVLVLEGRSEFDAIPAAARRLSDLDSTKFKSLENLGVAIVNACGDGNVAPLGEFFRSMGKVVFAIFDKQSPTALAEILGSVDHAYESPYKGFEDLVLHETAEATIRGYAATLVSANEWPPHLAKNIPTVSMPLDELRNILSQYFCWKKGSGDAGDLLTSCSTIAEVPEYVRVTLEAIKHVVEPPTLKVNEIGEIKPLHGEYSKTEKSLQPAQIIEKFQPHPPKPMS
jgi:putative ATP-dependent endonuclease of the OLD family